MTTAQPQALDILRQHAVIDGTAVRLDCGQLDRKLYQAVNEVLERAGGKWDRKAGAHLFTSDPSQVLAGILNGGELPAVPAKNPLAFFATPAPIVERMIARAGKHIHEVAQVLEPSAGDGAICDGVRATALDAVITAIEIDPTRAGVLRRKGYAVQEQDFLGFRPMMQFEAILMNPPFTLPADRFAYIAHIEHAYDMLAPWGRLVAIAPSGLDFRNDRRVAGFRAFVEARGGYEELPGGAFRGSDTGVNTVLLWIDGRR